MLALTLPLAASTALALVCFAMVQQLRHDRPQPPAARHRPTSIQPISAPPAPAVKAKHPFDPFTSPLAEVERFLAELDLAAADTRELEVVSQ